MFGKEDIDIEVADAIMEKPYGFALGKKHFYLYPITLGKMLLLSNHIKELGVSIENTKRNPYEEMLKVVKEKREITARIITYHTFDKKEDIVDVNKVARRSQYILKNAEDADLATLLVTVLAKDQLLTEFLKHFKIDKDKERMRKVLKVKDSKNNYSFGGKSMYGTLIDNACQRYGWTMDYVVWGISYINLQMLLADQQSSIFLTDAERKSCHVSQDGTFISGDNKENMKMIRQMFSD